MTETQKRIQAYKSALPGLRERVVAVALLLAMSMAMMTSASFAWLTISRRPEVSGVNTTIAANGNLELALASGDGLTAPGDSQVGDSSATKGQSITASNITWGNLVNLGDPAYGLDNLTLRPAQLNTTALLTSPLYGAVYSGDGRVEKLTSNFAYTAWVPAEGNIPAHFGVSNDMGVRAISSTKMELLGFYGDYMALRETADIANVTAGNTFVDLSRNTDWMNALATVLGVHMTATLNYEEQYINASVSQADLIQLIAMYEEFLKAYEQEAYAIACQLNLELFLAYGGDTTKYVPYTQESVLAIATNDSRLNSAGDFSYKVTNGVGEEKTIKITKLKTLLTDYNNLSADLVTLNTIKDGGDYRWTASGLKDVVANLVNVDTCLVKKQSESKFQTVKDLMSSFISNPLGALGYMGAKCDIVITNGVLYNFEQRTGTAINVQNLQVTAIMYVDTMNLGEQKANITAFITTSSEAPYEFHSDLKYADSLNTGADSQAGEVTAEDTYALAVDLWVRTNNQACFLTLEGNVLTRDEQEVATGKDANGNTVEIYTLTRTETIPAETDADGNTVEGSQEESVVITHNLYQGTNAQGQTVWYDADTYEEFTLEGSETPTKKMVTVTTVIGYEGENRVWNDDDKSYITSDSTTQGSGSCYVYYADTPEDQARSLELLKAMKVAFVDASGALLTTAEMDTDRFYAESGRVIVPLKLSADSVVIGQNDKGEAVYGITLLERNVPTRITAIVFLDGTLLSNQNVLAAADIQGKLNIQFGTSGTLNPIDNEKLEGEQRTVSASVSVNQFNYDTHVGDMKTRVSVRVDGDEPNQVTAFFLRQINSTQGSREEKMTFTYDENSGTWIADYIFTAPGNYILRTVQLDGVEYDLDEKPAVHIEGFTIESMTCTQADENRTINVLTAENSTSVDVTLKFAADDESKLPSTVQGRFLRADGTAVNVNFIYNATTHLWSGTANFLASGEYDFKYVVLDGEYVELDSDKWMTATVTLGMRVAIYTTSPTSFKYLPSEMTDNQKELGIQLVIMDNAGTPMPGLTGARLVYGMAGSSVSKMDTDLTWNPSSGYYEGALKTLESGGPGTWKFSYVKVGESIITNATIYPTFSLISPEPPSYKGFQALSYQYAPNGDAKLNAEIYYSATATVAAVIVDQNGKEYEVQGRLNANNDDNSSQWFFPIPTNAVGDYKDKQDGNWTMKEIRIWNYYDKEGNYYAAEIDQDGNLVPDGQRDNPMVIDMTGKNNVSKVVQTVKVTFTPGQGKDFGKDASGKVTATFMTSHEISGLNVTIRDFEGPLQDISNVKLAYQFGGDSLAKGGYTGNSVPGSGVEVFTINLTADPNDGTKFVQEGTQTIQFAGTYTPVFSFTFGGTNTTYSGNTLPANTPVFTVSSIAPSVEITAISTYGSSSKTATAATVYFNTSTNTTCGVTTTNYSQPYVTITLSNMGNATAANLTFTESSNGEVHLYPSNGAATSNKTNVYSWTANGTCQRWVGFYQSVSAGNDKRTLAGTLKATTLSLTYSGGTYNFTLATPITISNPN